MLRRAVCWLRRDLRLFDNTALSHATSLAHEVVPVFIFDSQILSQLADSDDKRVTFIWRSVEEVRERLQALHSGLLTAHGDPVNLVPKLCSALGAEIVIAAHDDDPYAVSRDSRTRSALLELGAEFRTVKDHVIFERREILSASEAPFKVFTPYCRAWRSQLDQADEAEHRIVEEHLVRPNSVDLLDAEFTWHSPSLSSLGFTESEPWTAAGESNARKALSTFEAEKIRSYDTGRDFPAREMTSGLSAHLRFGTLSVRECVNSVRSIDSPGAAKWLDELIWREFYQSILSNFPHVAEKAFKPEFWGVSWPGQSDHLDLWKAGMTGYPIVDAAMRCLKSTGWMHNRLRMVTAMFLTKDLLLDYRLGEAWFARWLLDFELASNNGGWQWCASTGVDAQPWFRIFNPLNQSIKFDEGAEFITKWCPELSGFSAQLAHWPHNANEFDQMAAGCVLGRDYPHPIVDHRVQRELALAFFKSVSVSQPSGSSSTNT